MGGEWSLGANTENLLFFSIVATQQKTRQRWVRRLLVNVKLVGAKTHINNW